jgi:type I restriction enzyme S subunit
MGNQFILPEGWKPKKIADLVIKTEQVNPAIDPENEFEYVDVSSVSNETFRITNSSKTLGKDAPSRARKVIKTNDVLFATVRPTLKRVAKVPAELDNQVCSTGYCVLRAKDEEALADYLFFSLLAPSFMEHMASIQKGASYPAVSDKEVKDTIIAVPPKNERRNIVHILSTLQTAIQKQEEIINTTTSLKKSLLNKLFTEGTKGEPLKQTEIGTIPESWELKKLGKLCNVSSGGTPSREVSEYWTGGTIPWVKTGEINYTFITETSEKITQLGLKNSSAKMFPAGTLLMAMYGQGITRGRVALLGIDATLNQACAAIIPFPEQEISSKYLYRYFEYQYEYIREFGHGANQKNLSGTIIKSIPIAYPKDENEQETIFTSIDAIQNKLEHHKRKKEVYEHLFRTLLNDLMIGAIRVNDVQFNFKSSSELLSAEQSSKTVTA